MNLPTEEQVKLMKSTGYFIQYINSKNDLKDHQIFDAIMRLDTIAKLIIENEWPDHIISEFFDLQEMKDVAEKFFSMLERQFEKIESGSTND